MVVLEIASRCEKNKYKAKLWSKATLFVLFTNSLTVFLPFLIAYKSKGFWLKHDRFYEQPDVRFKGEFIFVGVTENFNSPVLCNNFPYFQEHSSLDTCDKIKAREIDYNYDGKIDESYFYFEINLPTKLLYFDVILTLDYKLHTTCPLQMQSAIIHQEILPKFAKEIEITSQLQLYQSYPLFCHSKEKHSYYNYSIIQDEQSTDSYTIKKIIESYSKRNVTTHLKNIYRTYVTGNGETFIVKLNIRYPQQEIYYKTGFWQLIKNAWLQYFAVYIVTVWFVNKIKYYVFENNLVLYYDCSRNKKRLS